MRIGTERSERNAFFPFSPRSPLVFPPFLILETVGSLIGQILAV